MGKPPPPKNGPGCVSDPWAGPSLAELDRFTRASQAKWLTAARRITKLQQSLYFGLEQSRGERTKSLLGALRFAAQREFEFEHWSRILEHRYALDPLSLVGSLKKGGRFNIGEDLDPSMFTPFPALYVGEDYDVAFHECFGNDPGAIQNGLSATDFALRTPGSFTHVRLRGRLERVLDLDDHEALSAFAKIIGEMETPREVNRLVRELGLKRGPRLIRDAKMLRSQLLAKDWRINPMQFDLPANAQIFGRIAVAAGIQGLLYPSVRAGKGRCLALFVQNWSKSTSFIELEDAPPPNTHRTRWDGDVQHR